jgi:hypothetical protein
VNHSKLFPENSTRERMEIIRDSKPQYLATTSLLPDLYSGSTSSNDFSEVQGSETFHSVEIQSSGDLQPRDSAGGSGPKEKEFFMHVAAQPEQDLANGKELQKTVNDGALVIATEIQHSSLQKQTSMTRTELEKLGEEKQTENVENVYCQDDNSENLPISQRIEIQVENTKQLQSPKRRTRKEITDGTKGEGKFKKRRVKIEGFRHIQI